MNGPSPHRAAAAAWNHSFVSIRMEPATPASLLTSQPASFLFFPPSQLALNTKWATLIVSRPALCFFSHLGWSIFHLWGMEHFPFFRLGPSGWKVCWSAHCSLGSHSRLGVTPVWDPRRHTAQSRMQMVPLEFFRTQPVWPRPGSTWSPGFL